MDERDPLPVDTGRGFSLLYRESYLYSRRDPEAAPELAASRTAMLPDTLYLVPSPCLCHGLRTLVAALPASSAVLCVELEEPLAVVAAQAGRDLFVVGGRAALVPARDPGTVVARALALGSFRRVVSVRLSQGWKLHAQDYEAMARAIEDELSLSWRNRMTLVRMGRLWARNLLSNLAAMPWDDVEPLTPVVAPLVVCGAGPSLAAVLPWMREHRRGLHLMAVDTAVGSLAMAGLVPDTVVCLEGQAHNLRDFVPLSGAPVGLIADVSAHPAGFHVVRGRKSLLSSAWVDCGLLRRLGAAGLPIVTVPPLGSVGVLALYVAKLVARGPVFVSGLDFMFTPGATHCPGSPADRDESLRESRLYRRARGWAASYGAGARSAGAGRLSDPALEMYARLASEVSAGACFMDLRGGFGAPLPLEPMDEGDAAALVERYASSGSGSVPTAAPVEPAGCRAIAHAFLSSELELAEELRSTLRGAGGTRGLGDLVGLCDYMYAHFPDPDRVRALELDALKRLAAEASYWVGRLEDALATSDGATR